MQSSVTLHRTTINTLVFLLFALVGCYQSDPRPASFNTDTFGRIGDSVRFSGLDWTVKIYEDVMHGPGPNYFSGDERDVFLDENGYLHMRIAQHQGKWMSSEVVADEPTGYGTYRFTIEGMLDAIPDNIVLGLFTWDNTTFQEQANSEVDIEFSKWGDANAKRTLQYGVQPINFGPYYPERDFVPEYVPGTMNGVSVHEFTWTDKLITWRSYAGDRVDPTRLIGEWSFDQSNPGRVKNEGGRSSKPIVIPAPGNETSARINFWILTGIAPGPKDNARHEVIIRKFEYLPL
ncbi:MAG: hypothetical protein H6606_01400 [Flavobacteriales bacterium]|nr:hypothetical protein [Flavobacteriales bacterium]